MIQSFVLGLLVLTLLVIAGCTGAPNTDGNSPNGQTGRAVFSMTDAAADMGSVQKVNVTIDSVDAYSETNGWVRVNSQRREYDWLELKSQSKTVVLADAQLEEGSYSQVRMNVSKVTVTDANGVHEAKTPTREWVFDGQFTVESNTTSSAHFDFQADESVHVANDSSYVVAPVTVVETRDNASVNVQSSDRVIISGGSVRTSQTVGMDISGNIGVGIRIPVDAVIDVGITGLVSIGSDSMIRS